MSSQEITTSPVNFSARGSRENTTDFNSYSSVEFIEYEIAEWMWKIIPPIIFAVGIIGNILSVIVMSRKKMRSGTLAVYVIALAVTDLGSLVAVLIRYSLLCMYDLDILNISDGICKAHTFATYFLGQLSAWILVSLTTERAIAIRWPHSWHFTRQKAAVTLSIIAMVLFGANAHFLYGEAIESTWGCMPRSGDYMYFIFGAWTWIDMCLLALAPFAFLVAGNALIIREINKSERKTPHFISKAARRANKDRNQSKRVGIMLIVVCATFIVCMLPQCIYLVLTDGSPEIWKAPHEWAIAELVQKLSIIFTYLNTAANFYLYCFSGSKFRREFIQILSCKSPKEPGAKTVNPRSVHTEGRELVTHM